MPKHFADRMIDDAIRCISEADIIADEAKPRLISQVLDIRQAQCTEVLSCGVCPLAERCEDRIGAILNGEGEALSHHGSLLRIVTASAA